MSDDSTIRLLIAALGGEGGAVLAGWITDAAMISGCAAQRTSVPGVAQRTGATTYYVEISPAAGARRPVMGLTPTPGEVDVFLSSELLEATRAIQSGFVSPDRTTTIASLQRAYTVTEKSAMGDGRLDPDALASLIGQFSKRSWLLEIERTASLSGAHANSILLGALAGSSILPIDMNAFRKAIEQEGKAVASNLRGFEAGLQLVRENGRIEDAPPPRLARAPTTLAELEDAVRRLPNGAADVALEGVRRLTDYQDAPYARSYLRHIERFTKLLDEDGLAALARRLAVRMSFEDTIRVAQLKMRGDRLGRLRQEAKAQTGEIIHVTEFMKPGPEEIFGMLPPSLGRPLMNFVERRGWRSVSFGMQVRTTSLFGYFRLALLAKMRPWRPRTLRFAQESAWVTRWLDLIDRTAMRDRNAAREVIETADLVKGYGDTYRRGMANWDMIMTRIVEPWLSGKLAGIEIADAIMQARIAALADPEGRRAEDVVAAVENAGRRAE